MSYQAYRGNITITTGTNDTIAWWESDGTPANLTATITGDTYSPDTLADAIADAMTQESGSSGRNINYTASINSVNGVMTITADSDTWYPKITSTETQKILTGGDPGAVGAFGDNHAGWYEDSAYPAAAASHSSDTAHSNSWYPSQGRETDNEGSRQNLVIESTSIGGSTTTYSFGPDTRDTDPTRVRSISYHELTQADRDQFENEFWHAYAKKGLVFEFWSDRTNSSTAVNYKLTGESLKKTAFSRARPTTTKWNLSFQMRRA